jgi:integrase
VIVGVSGRERPRRVPVIRTHFLQAGEISRIASLPAAPPSRLPRLTFHALRHTAATLMLGAGTHIRVVADRLGHADPAVTLRVYGHVTPTMQRAAADELDAVLGGTR